MFHNHSVLLSFATCFLQYLLKYLLVIHTIHTVPNICYLIFLTYVSALKCDNLTVARTLRRASVLCSLSYNCRYSFDQSYVRMLELISWLLSPKAWHFPQLCTVEEGRCL